MRRTPFYGGLFLLTFSTLMLELVQTRLLSVVTWYHLAFFVISAAMFGMTAGAVWVYLRRELFTPDRLAFDLARLTSAFALTSAVSVVFQVTLAPVIVGSVTAVAVFVELTLSLALPFFFSGAAVSLALTRSPFQIGSVYAADLAGAALGCLGVLGLLQLTDATSAILLIGAVASGGAWLFLRSEVTRHQAHGFFDWLLTHPGMILIVLAAAGLANGFLRQGLQPIIVKNKIESRQDITYERWNHFSRVIAGPAAARSPGLWGPSSRLPGGTVADQIFLNIDGSAATTMFRFGGNPRDVEFLRYDVSNLAYFLRHSGRSAVIGVGSGRDVLSAWMFGLRDVTGVEINPIFIDLLQRREPFRGFAGIAPLAGVRLIVDDARSWFSRTPERFDLIQMSMIDTWAATGAGAFTLTENGLYTIEAWTRFLDRLTTRGVFTVSRWHAPGEVNETGRMVSLAVASLLQSGVRVPQAHLFLATSGNVATLVLSRSPLEPGELQVLDEVCRDYDYRVLLRPDRPAASDVLSRIVTAGDIGELVRRTSGEVLDLTPPTDNRPFFFNVLPLSRPMGAIHALRNERGGVLVGNVIASLTLLTILAISVVLVVVAIVIPLRPAIREAGRELVVGGTMYFALLGLGFMFVEVGLLQRLSVFLGHPIYSLSIVLASLIMTTGLGSWLSERLRIEQAGRFGVWAMALAAYLLSLPFWLALALELFQTAGIGPRAFASVAVIAPAGVLMGFAFPTGMRLVEASDKRPTPWFWGINGAAGVLASVLAVAVSIAFGIGVTFVLGGLCYFGLLPAAAVLRSSANRVREAMRRDRDPIVEPLEMR
jgi:hypothetical protein